MTMRLIEGAVEPDDDRDARIVELERTNRQLSRDLATARGETQRAKDESAAALSNLRRQLSPLYRALQMVFGELDAAGIGEASPSSTGTPNSDRTTAVWTSWKSKLGVGPAKLIDALLLHGEMNTQQLAIACGMNRNTVPNYIHALNKAGLISKNGGRFSLKSLT